MTPYSKPTKSNYDMSMASAVMMLSTGFFCVMVIAISDHRREATHVTTSALLSTGGVILMLISISDHRREAARVILMLISISDHRREAAPAPSPAPSATATPSPSPAKPAAAVDMDVVHGFDEAATLFEEEEPTVQEARDAFAVLDRNGDGIIDTGELQSVLRYSACWGRQIDVSCHVKMLCNQDFTSKKMNGESSRYDKLESMLQGGSSEPHNVPLKYLRTITDNFSDEQLLGEGGFGTVYKGVLQNGETIAVKKLKLSIPGVQDRQFENEVSHLMRLEHPNVVLLVGWCSETQYIPMEYNGTYICAEKSERLLCLEYMPRGNLRGFLSDESSGLGWDTLQNNSGYLLWFTLSPRGMAT